MLFLILAVLSSSMVSIVMRISTDKISANISMLAVNYLVCSFLGAAYAGFDLLSMAAEGFSLMVALGAVAGVLYLAGFVLLQRSVRKNGIVLSSVFMKLGLLVPIALSLLLFGEVPTAAQVTGFVIALCAIVMINLKKEPGAKGFGMGLIILLLTGGSCDAMSKIYEVFGAAALSEQFLFYTFFVALLLCGALALRNRERPGLRELVFGTLIGLPNFFSAKFLLLALTRLPAVVVYPSFSVATMLVVTVTGVVAFRERLNRLQWVALAAIVAALVLLNI